MGRKGREAVHNLTEAEETLKGRLCCSVSENGDSMGETVRKISINGLLRTCLGRPESTEVLDPTHPVACNLVGAIS